MVRMITAEFKKKNTIWQPDALVNTSIGVDCLSPECLTKSEMKMLKGVVQGG